jgi:uncharacterized protein YjeT (DUF2065 family)
MRMRLAALVAFATAMAWLEAIVVVYIREIVGIPRHGGMPPLDEVMRRLQSAPWLMPTEQLREMATMVMLLGVGYLAAQRWRARLGAFLVAFGVWDIGYYVALYVLTGWPPSLTAIDLLFLVPPGPWWYQPVWIPVAISLVMVVAGLRLMGGREPARAR